MVGSLTDYIRQLVSEGYNETAIKQYMTKYGYNLTDINNALATITNEKQQLIHHHHMKAPLIIASISLIVVIAALGGFFFIYAAPAQLLDLETTSRITEISPGEVFEFEVELISTGSKKRYDVFLEHQLKRKGKTILTQEQTVAVETRASKSTDIKLPEDLSPGTYQLVTKATYNKKFAITSLSFKVKKAPKCPDSCDDNEPCTEDICGEETDYKCEHNVLTPCCGNMQCEEGETPESCDQDCKQEETTEEQTTVETTEEIDFTEQRYEQFQKEREEQLKRKQQLEEVVGLARTSLFQALEKCETFESANDKDSCFFNIAIGSKADRVCPNIQDQYKRDRCFMKIAMETGDFSNCDKIEHKLFKRNCNALKGVVGFG